MAGWEPGTLQASTGQDVTITIVNLDNRFHTDGGGWHNFVVPDLGAEFRVPPRGTTTFTFAATAAPGDDTFSCDVCCGGKDNPFMQGTLSVS